MKSRIDAPRQTETEKLPFREQREVLLTMSELFGRKWHAPVLYRLRQESRGFAELKNEIHGISGKMLAESLNRLTEEYGVVERHEVSGGLTRVEYSLSPEGEQLVPLLEGLYDWGDENLELPPDR